MKTFFREMLVTLVLALAIFFVVQSTLQTFIVVGSSMQPTFNDGQRLVVNKAVYIFRQPERGDVVILVPPAKGEPDYIKRIIALPGDTVEVKDGAVYINGTKQNEPYIKSPPNYRVEEKKIPPGNYFVLGDNRGNSNDSHTGWLVPRENLVGKAWLSIWPVAEVGLVRDYHPQGQAAASMVN